MLMRTAWPAKARRSDVLAAAILTLATMAAASAEARPPQPPGGRTAALAEGLPGEGLPPSPGPTNPTDPAQ
jgi:hypothetical protein